MTARARGRITCVVAIAAVTLLGLASTAAGARLDGAGAGGCSLVPGASLTCWGPDFSGRDQSGRQLPPGAIGQFNAPVDIAAGASTLCAVLASSAVNCFGSNTYGELGNGTVDFDDHPQAVVSTGLESGAKAIYSSWATFCALLETGALKCWGYNARGQVGSGWVGDGVVDGATRPEQVAGLTGGVRAVAMSSSTNCAIVGAVSQVKCWGSNEFGQLGIGRRGNPSTGLRGYGGFAVPVNVKRLPSGVAGVGLSDETACVLTKLSRAYCWGGNRRGEISKSSRKAFTSPIRVRLPIKPVQIDGGNRHLCARSADGRVACWGENDFGQVGNGSRSKRARPTVVRGLPGAASVISSDGDSACAGLTSGAVYCWGLIGYVDRTSLRPQWSTTPRLLAGVMVGG